MDSLEGLSYVRRFVLWLLVFYCCILLHKHMTVGFIYHRRKSKVSMSWTPHACWANAGRRIVNPGWRIASFTIGRFSEAI